MPCSARNRDHPGDTTIALLGMSIRFTHRPASIPLSTRRRSDGRGMPGLLAPLHFGPLVLVALAGLHSERLAIELQRLLHVTDHHRENCFHGRLKYPREAGHRKSAAANTLVPWYQHETTHPRTDRRAPRAPNDE